MHERGEAEHVRRSIPRRARHPLGRRIRPANRRDGPNGLQRRDHAKARKPRLVGREQDVARMQRAVQKARGGRNIKCISQLRTDTHGICVAYRPLFAHHGVQRFRRHILLRQVCLDTLDARDDKLCDGWMRQAGRDDRLELGDEPVDAIGREIEAEELDRDQPILVRIVRAKNRAESAGANLMKDSKWTKHVGRCSTHSFRLQRKLLSGRQFIVTWKRSFPYMPSSMSGDSSVRVPVDIRRLPWVRRLAADYAYDFRQLAPFYAGDPSDHASWAAAIARMQARGAERSQIASVIAAQQRRRQAPARALEAGEQLANPRTVAIVTGQQAGLFGGPLFTLLKALTALKLADQVSHDHQVPVVAVFWIDAEDHDWNEVRSCTVFDDTLAPRTVSLPPDGAADGAPVAAVRLTDAVVAALDDLERVLPATEFRPSLVAALRHAYAPGTGMAAAFGCWLEAVLGDRGLVVFDSSDPVAKPLASGIFVRELSMPGRTTSLARAAGADLVACGYHAQVQTAADGPALFRLVGHDLERINGRRRAIQQQDGHFLIDGAHHEPARLVDEAGHRPEGFSPNVLLRPLVQDTLFPTICYVAGPSELAYLGQLRDVYAHFGVSMPLMYPRASATLLDSAGLRFLTKYGLPIEAIGRQDDAALNELVAKQIPPEIEASLADAGRAIDAGMARAIEMMPSLDPTLEGAARTTLGRMQHDLQTLHGKMIQAAKKRNETLKRQFVRVQALAFPGGHAQERAIGFVSFLNQYGPALVERLEDELPLDIGQHWIVTV